MGTKERKQREKQQRITLILDAAERVFFAEGGAAATMGAVAEAAELSKGLLYFYFKDKEDLYNALSQRGLRILHGLLLEAVAQPAEGIDQLEAIGHAYWDFFRRYPNAFEAVAHYENYVPSANDPAAYAVASETEATKVLDLITETVRTGIADGSIRAELNPAQTAIIAWAQLHGVLQTVHTKRLFLKAHANLDPDHIIRPAIALIRRAIGKD